MKKTGYKWWIDRIRAMTSVVDFVRIDHFRGFEAYWSVPAGEETAINGKWIPGPDHDLFNKIKEELGDIPIIASAGGTVIRANYDKSYGNVVFLTHVINGKVYTTVYAHMEKMFVSNGQSVQQGQLLGYMGNTGNSFGAHLHFEIHEGSWNGSRSNSVNPLKYVSY